MLTRKRVLSIALKWSFLGYVDLSKRRVAEDDMKIADKKYQEAKKVHNIAGILANHCHMDIDDVYLKIIDRKSVV